MPASAKDFMETHFRQISGKRPSSPGVISSLLTVIGSIVLLTLGLMFSLVILAVIPLLLLLGYGYLRWKTREFRQRMAQEIRQDQNPFTRQHRGDDGHGVIIEGEILGQDKDSPR